MFNYIFIDLSGVAVLRFNFFSCSLCVFRGIKLGLYHYSVTKAPTILIQWFYLFLYLGLSAAVNWGTCMLYQAQEDSRCFAAQTLIWWSWFWKVLHLKRLNFAWTTEVLESIKSTFSTERECVNIKVKLTWKIFFFFPNIKLHRGADSFTSVFLLLK